MIEIDLGYLLIEKLLPLGGEVPTPQLHGRIALRHHFASCEGNQTWMWHNVQTVLSILVKTFHPERMAFMINTKERSTFFLIKKSVQHTARLMGMTVWWKLLGLSVGNWLQKIKIKKRKKYISYYEPKWIIGSKIENIRHSNSSAFPKCDLWLPSNGWTVVFTQHYFLINLHKTWKKK